MRRITTLTLLLSFLSFSLFSQQYNPGPRLMGFSAEGSSRERELESKFDAQLKADNLRDWMRGRGEPQPYAQEFSEWVRERLERHELDDLADYRAKAPSGARAHPTDEHFLPLFFALGAAREDYKAERFYSSIDAGVLSMDAYVFN